MGTVMAMGTMSFREASPKSSLRGAGQLLIMSLKHGIPSAGGPGPLTLLFPFLLFLASSGCGHYAINTQS